MSRTPKLLFVISHLMIQISKMSHAINMKFSEHHTYKTNIFVKYHTQMYYYSKNHTQVYYYKYHTSLFLAGKIPHLILFEHCKYHTFVKVGIQNNTPSLKKLLKSHTNGNSFRKFNARSNPKEKLGVTQISKFEVLNWHRNSIS